MIKAYHHVYRAPLDQILQKGVIAPVAFRLDPKYLEGCIDMLQQVQEYAADDGNPEAIRGIELLIESRWKEIEAVSSGETDDTGLFCGDILAGDAFSVFLSTGWWGRVDENLTPNGFVFDAEDLIRRGAVVREGDLLGVYDDIITGSAWLKGSAPAIRDQVLRQLYATKKEAQMEGEAAISYLKKDPGEWEELAFEGSLNLDWAIEMWDNGTQVQPLEKS